MDSHWKKHKESNVYKYRRFCYPTRHFKSNLFYLFKSFIKYIFILIILKRHYIYFLISIKKKIMIQIWNLSKNMFQCLRKYKYIIFLSSSKSNRSIIPRRDRFLTALFLSLSLSPCWVLALWERRIESDKVNSHLGFLNICTFFNFLIWVLFNCFTFLW